MNLKPEDFEPIINNLNTYINVETILTIIGLGIVAVGLPVLTIWGIRKILTFIENAIIYNQLDPYYKKQMKKYYRGIFSSHFALTEMLEEQQEEDFEYSQFIDERNDYRNWFKEEYGVYPEEVDLPEDCVIDL